ncbi:ribosome maturation factor RimP [Lebetimonas sp. JH292]|uniref:ribosome maturation factor RimP n=1 Tax=Lebetimonas sp. JH292 TaxID=990068 RepID=UPI0004634E5E|nr:ribosome maturation factor RimP [Lebetimonas sp. JH292]
MNNLKEIIEKTVKNYGCDLYDVEITEEGGHKYFRIYITKPGGVNLNDCEAINNMLSPIFDVEEPIKERYFLEVSSPGLERKLTKKEHFEKSIGERVKVKTAEGKKIKGILKSFDGDVAEIGDEKVKFEDIKKAKTYVDWNNYKGLK